MYPRSCTIQSTSKCRKSAVHLNAHKIAWLDIRSNSFPLEPNPCIKVETFLCFSFIFVFVSFGNAANLFIICSCTKQKGKIRTYSKSNFSLTAGSATLGFRKSLLLQFKFKDQMNTSLLKRYTKYYNIMNPKLTSKTHHPSICPIYTKSFEFLSCM